MTAANDTFIKTFHATLYPRWRRAWTRADRSEKCIDEYGRDCLNYFQWCQQNDLEIASFDSADEYVGHRESSSKYGGRNAARAIKALGKFLSEQYEEPDMFAKLQVPKTPEPTKTPTATEDDLAKLLATCEKDWKGLRDRAIILILAHTGMRRSEVAAIAPEDIDLGAQRLVIPKTKTRNPRVVRLHDDVVTALLRFQKATPDTSVMWPSMSSSTPVPYKTKLVSGREVTALKKGPKTMTPLTIGGMGLMLLNREKAAGITLGSHSWRRKLAGDWLAKGGSESGLMAWAGWSSTAMVAKYAKSVAQENALAEAERLFG